jgi:hypothetical protein
MSASRHTMIRLAGPAGAAFDGYLSFYAWRFS